MHLTTRRRHRWTASLATTLTLGLAFGLATTTACTRSQPAVVDAEQVVADPAMHAILRHVPADTPYAFVSLGGKGSREFLGRVYAPVLAAMPQLETLVEGMVHVSQSPLARAIFAELRGKMSREGLAQLGFDPDARFALYGLGILPALRLQLADAGALKAALARIEQVGGVTFQTRKLGDVEYWYVGGKAMEVGIAILGDHLIIALAPTSQVERAFRLAFGLDLPERHLGQSERFKQLLAEKPRLSLGFVDARTIAEAFIGEGDAFTRDTIAAIDPVFAAAWPGLSSECKQEIRSLVALAPRLVFGTDHIDATGFRGHLTLELRPDVAQEVMALRASVPGLNRETFAPAMMAFGGGFDFSRALTVARSRAAALKSAPYQCPQLAELNRIDQQIEALSRNAPAELWQTRGFAMVLDDVKFAGFMPSDPRGFLSVSYTDTKGLMAALRNVPGFFGEELRDDGTIVALAAGAIPFTTAAAYKFEAGQGGIIAVGKDAEARVKNLHTAPESTDPPLLLLTYDLRRFADMLSAMNSALPSEANILIDVYRNFGTIEYEGNATARGLELRIEVKLPPK